MTYTLQMANEYINKNIGKVNKQYRPLYHFAPPVGWMNDPNGLIYYKNEYHIFYQFYPYDTCWEAMHWGHAVSNDLIRFKDCGVALSPDRDDESGCFSGGAVVNDSNDNELILFYTRHLEVGGQRKQTQCIAVSNDGENFIKSEAIITEKDLPLNASVSDFRDPKPVFLGGKYYIFIASKNDENVGQVLVYCSEDLSSFEYFTTIGPNEHFGEMAECPDYFHLDGKDVLILSAINSPKKPNNNSNSNSNSCIYIVGKFDIDKKEFLIENINEIDSGYDFYAPQTLIDESNRRIMLAWMEMWKNEYFLHKNRHGWNGSLTCPRELKIVNNMLYQNPIKEIENYRGTKLQLTNGMKIPKAMDIVLEIEENTIVRFSNPNNSMDYFEFGRESNSLYIDCDNLAITKQAKAYSKFQYDGIIRLRVLLDLCSIELFIDNGKDVITSKIFMDSEDYTINIFRNDVNFIEAYEILGE